MAPSRIRGITVLVLALVFVSGCHRRRRHGARAGVDGAASVSTSASAHPSLSAASPPLAAPSREVIQKQLRSFFRVFGDSSNFEALRPFFAPSVERFITLDHPTIATIIDSSKRFFRDKRDVAYTPAVDRMALRVVDGRGTLAALRVEMSWRSPVPASWGPSWDVGEGHVREDVFRRVQADVELLLDDRNAIVSYVETGVVAPPLTVTGDCERVCVDPLLAWGAPVHCEFDADRETRPAPVATLRPRTVVHDLGETVAAGGTPKGSWGLRKVRFSNRTVWVLDHNPVAVDNPLGGTSAGQVDCLVPDGASEVGP